MNQPKVSVIIPVYNTEKYLRECLDSVVNQTLEDIEIICVDDGSTDSSPEILREYAAKDSRVKVFSQEKSNAGAARNVGLSKATGEYLAFLDSDDYYDLTMLGKMLACAQKRKADVVVCRSMDYYEDTGKTIQSERPVKKKLLPQKTVFAFRDIECDCFQRIWGYNWDKLFNRSLVTENQLSFQSQAVYNDNLFTYSALISAKRITVLDEALVFYRHRSGRDSITDKRNLHIDCAYTWLKGLKQFLVQSGSYGLYERDFINYVYHMFYVDLTSKARDADSEMEMNRKIASWLDEFHANGYADDYYYDLPEREKLLNRIRIKTGRDFGISLPVIVSLTSYPARINTVGRVIDMMKNQTVKADKILLWLTEEEFPDGAEMLPQELLSKTDDCFEVKWCHNLKPHNKYYYAMLEYPESIIITVDDDVIYSDDLIEKLIRSYVQFPYAVSAMLARRVTFDQEGKIAPFAKWIRRCKTVGIPSSCLHALGLGGVLYPPHCMHDELFNAEAIKALCPYADDLWLMAMQILKGTPVVLADKPVSVRNIEGTQETALWNSNGGENKNDEQFARILEKYDSLMGEKDTITQRIWVSYLSFQDRTLKKEIDTLRHDLEQQKQRAERLQAALDNEKKESDTLRRDLEKQKKESDTLRRDLEKQKKRADTLQYDLDCVHDSVSFRVGRIITWAPRKVRGGVWCFRDHGAGYTFRRALYHMGLWKDEEEE